MVSAGSVWDDILRPQMSPTTVDVRSAGMGGVAVAGITGSNAIFTNPAAVGATQKSSIALGVEGRFGAIKDEYSKAQFDSYKSSYKPYLQLTHISAALPIGIKDSPLGFAIGVGYHDQYTASRTFYKKSVLTGTTAETYEKYRGSMNLISPAVALSIKNKFGIGLAVNQTLPGAFGKVSEVDKNNGTELPADEYSGSAFYLTVGIRALLIKNKLSLGGAFYSPAQWTFKKGENEEGDFTAPRMFALGAQFQVTKQILAALEFQTRLFATMLAATVSGDKLNNGVAIRLGGEYNLDPLLVRLGLNLENVPRTDMTQTAEVSTNESPKLAFGANAGIGIPLKPLTIQAALGWSRFGYEVTDESAGTSTTYAYSENHFKLDLGITLDLPGAKIGRGETKVDEGAEVPQPLDIGK
jgi:hypothetical protein